VILLGKFEELISSNIYLDNLGFVITDKIINKTRFMYNHLIKLNPYKKLEFIYYGEPKPAPRPRWSRKTNRFYDPGSKDKTDIQKFINLNNILPVDFETIDGDIKIFTKFYKKPVESFSRINLILAELGILRPDIRPDIDNYSKTVFDALNKLIWSDDSRIVTMKSEKFYSIEPRIEIKVLYRERRHLDIIQEFTQRKKKL